jgi:putative transposase
MKRSRFGEEQITYAMLTHEAGTPVEDICRRLGVSQATFYLWKKKYAHMGVSELRELRLLRDENPRLKRVHRLYCLEGLQLRMRVRRRKHECLHRGPVPKASRHHERLSMDFVHDLNCVIDRGAYVQSGIRPST